MSIQKNLYIRFIFFHRDKTIYTYSYAKKYYIIPTNYFKNCCTEKHACSANQENKLFTQKYFFLTLPTHQTFCSCALRFFLFCSWKTTSCTKMSAYKLISSYSSFLQESKWLFTNIPKITCHFYTFFVPNTQMAYQ